LGSDEAIAIARSALSRWEAADARAGAAASAAAASSVASRNLPTEAPELVAEKAYGRRDHDGDGGGAHLVHAQLLDQAGQYHQVDPQGDGADGQEARVLVMRTAVVDAERPHPVQDEVAGGGDDERDRERQPVGQLGVRNGVDAEVDEVAGGADDAVADQLQPVVRPAQPDMQAPRMCLQAEGRLARGVLHRPGILASELRFGRGGSDTQQVPFDKGLHVGDRGDGRDARVIAEAGGDQRDQRVLGPQRPVATAAGVVVAAGVGELPPQPRRHHDVAGAPAAQRALDPLQRVRVLGGIEQVAVAGHRPGAAARVHVIATAPEPLAAAEAALTDDDREYGCAVVNIGAEITSLMIFGRGAVQHTAVFPFGSMHFTKDIAVGLRVSIPEANKIKHHYGCVASFLMDDQERQEVIEIVPVGRSETRGLSKEILCDIMQPRAVEMLQHVAHEVVGTHAQISSGVILTGGGSLARGMVEIAEQVFDAPTRLGLLEPEYFGGLMEKIQGPQWAVACGLAMSSMRSQLRSFESNGRHSPWKVSAWLENFREKFR